MDSLHPLWETSIQLSTQLWQTSICLVRTASCSMKSTRDHQDKVLKISKILRSKTSHKTLANIETKPHRILAATFKVVLMEELWTRLPIKVSTQRWRVKTTSSFIKTVTRVKASLSIVLVLQHCPKSKARLRFITHPPRQTKKDTSTSWKSSMKQTRRGIRSHEVRTSKKCNRQRCSKLTRQRPLWRVCSKKANSSSRHLPMQRTTPTRWMCPQCTPSRITMASTRIQCHPTAKLAHLKDKTCSRTATSRTRMVSHGATSRTNCATKTPTSIGSSKQSSMVISRELQQLRVLRL